jgi:glycosyltransferase involved in cell wall biosynthesis
MRLPYAMLGALRQSPLCNTRWDGVIWYSPTIFLGPLVRVLRRESGCRTYLILRDIFPEWAVDMGLMNRGPAYFFFKFIERQQYAVADTVGVQSAANLPYMRKWAARLGGRLEVLQNWLGDADDTGCRIRVDKGNLAGRKIFAYVGNMGVAQAIDVFLDMAARMRKRHDVGFVFVGRGSDAASQRLENVLFHEEIEPCEIPGLLVQCHVGIVALDRRHKTHNVPGKFLTYMQAGVPVLACINPGNDLVNLINDQRVGFVCTSGDPATLVRLAEKLISDPEELRAMGYRARALARRMFSTHRAVQQIVAALSA